MASTSTYVYGFNNQSDGLSVDTTISSGFDTDDWSNPAPGLSLPSGGEQTEFYWIDRVSIPDGGPWIVTSIVTVGGSTVQLQIQLTDTDASSDLALQVLVGKKATGWSPVNAQLRFMAADDNVYSITATFVSSDDGFGFDDVAFAVSPLPNAILPQIDHVVVLMFENRSFDNVLGWLYPSGTSPTQFLGLGSGPFNGLNNAAAYPSQSYEGQFFNANDAGDKIIVTNGTSQWKDDDSTIIKPWCVPNPDPQEEHSFVMKQIAFEMSGFLTDYATVEAGGPANQIMQCYSVGQLRVINTVARLNAVSDAWFASVPTQTWPNRGFVQTGSSDGHINNDDSEPYANTTIFDVLGNSNISWAVYNDGPLQSLTKTMFLDKYELNTTNFLGMQPFVTACIQPADAAMNVKLPAFSFVEPNFGFADTQASSDQSYHPPNDVRLGEQFLVGVYDCMRNCAYRDRILFIILFDEHGGTYDHVEPPTGAMPPAPYPKVDGFDFGQFGVRVPAIVVSSWVKPGTVFRSDTAVPLDHTSVLATLRDWQGLASAFEDAETGLPSPRIQKAPNLAFVLSEQSPNAWSDEIGRSSNGEPLVVPDDHQPLNDLQKGILVAARKIASRREGVALTTAEIAATKARLHTVGDSRRELKSLEPHLPLR